MFAAWGRWVFAHRRAVLAVSAAFLLASLASLLVGGRLTSGRIHGIEADTAAELIDRELPQAGASGLTIVLSHAEWTTDEPRFQEAALRALAPLRRDPSVLRVRSPFDEDVSAVEASTMQSLDTHHAIATVALRHAATVDTRGYPALRRRIVGGPLTVTVTGLGAFRADLDAVLERDLQRAELLSAPLTLVVLLAVFGSVVAALLPAGIGALAVAAGVAAVMLLSWRMEVAQYAINIVSLVGLGVAIDYSLFMVNRFREELAAGLSVEDAVARTVATAGRAVAFSGLAVVIGLSGLFFFRGSYLVSLGLGGTLVVTFAALYALTFLPALLSVLGPNVNRWRIGGGAKTHSGGFWHRHATWVMRRPLLVLLPTLTLLLVLGRPFLDMKVAIPDMGVLPASTETRRGHGLLVEHFTERAATRVVMVARFPGGPLQRRDRVLALRALSARVAAIPGVERVESVVDLDPTLEPDALADVLMDPGQHTEGHQLFVRDTVGPNVVVLSALTEAAPASEAARSIVRAVRSQRRVADGELLVTGQSAMDLDTAAYLRARVGPALGFVVVMTMLVLLALLGSVALPIKAVLMNLLSITGSFGALIWIFQKGHLAGVLRFTPGPIDPSLPILMFCATFGLSMDYEVLMLTRMQEEYARHGDNTRAVAEGLERSGRLVTSAAAIMVAVFAAFAMADVILLKAMGVGMALAVALDATIVRILVVPATMRLLGDWNWWAPAFIQRIQRRLNHGGH
ncbi:MAG: MMPL family transporter [Deltaproteobacteria bacterium]|nr:MMPL family transporter [Myxococcales bacterium]MDP3220612.1 MMPL family transporter [Deltaproteobacteria bacterium]